MAIFVKRIICVLDDTYYIMRLAMNSSKIHAIHKHQFQTFKPVIDFKKQKLTFYGKCNKSMQAVSRHYLRARSCAFDKDINNYNYNCGGCKWNTAINRILSDLL